MVVIIATVEKVKERKETSQEEALEQRGWHEPCLWLAIEACVVAPDYGQQW